MKQKYIRDKRSPKPSKESTSKVMSANKAKNTKPEILLRKALWNNGIKGYRLHLKKAPGRPDIAFTKKKIAIFVNGCYWHRCPYCQLPLPKNNTEFWTAKFKRSVERDKEKIELLKKNDWNSVIVWECQLKNDIFNCVKKIEKELNESTD